MNANELNELLKSGKSGLLLNVLPEEIHAARHIAGSSNACVYEMAFLDKVAELAPAKDLPIVVYGAGDGSLDSKVALEKLRAAGYTQVTDLPEGLAGWEAAGFPLAGDGDLPPPLALAGTYRVDTKESVIRWTGRNLFNHHSGTVRLASGEIRIASGLLESARFVIDMNSIACEDLEDSQWNAMLIRHLRDADFFEIDRFPAAEFIADRAEAVAACSDGTPNFLLKGRFTLRGVTKPLELPVVIASADGKRVTGQGQLELDRTEFGSIYGSGKFFRFLGKHVVNDHIHLHVKIHADLNSAE
jgi:polyisoprenoid-binding protein YceI